jgi:large subunit ribosomal protein L3
VCNKLYGNYWTVQVGAINVSPEKANRSLLFHYRRFRVAPKRITREFQVHRSACIPSGFKLNAAHFVAGQYVDVFGVSKGKGFQGVVKRHGFAGGNASHGASLSHRTPGSIGTNKVIHSISFSFPQ